MLSQKMKNMNAIGTLVCIVSMFVAIALLIPLLMLDWIGTYSTFTGKILEYVGTRLKRLAKLMAAPVMHFPSLDARDKIGSSDVERVKVTLW